MTAPWDPELDPVDYVILAGKKSPGIAEVVGASSPRNWDEHKGFGVSGAICIFTGRGLAKFSIVIKLVTRQDWIDWYAWRPIVDKLPKRRIGGTGKDSGSIDIVHPHTLALGIKAIGVVEVMQPVQSDAGEWSVEIKVIEFRRPKFGFAKPEGSAATPVDPVEEEWIKPLTEQFQSLAAEE